MGRYRKVSVRMHADAEYRRLTPPPPCGQSLFNDFLTGPDTTNIPGVFKAREGGIADRLNWPIEGFRKAFREVSGEAFADATGKTPKPLAKADWDAGLVFVPGAIKHNAPESPNVIRAWRDTWEELPECDLKSEAYRHLRDFIETKGEGFQKAFREAIPEPSWEGCRQAIANQEQEQEQEQTPQSPPGGGVDFPEQIGKDPGLGWPVEWAAVFRALTKRRDFDDPLGQYTSTEQHALRTMRMQCGGDLSVFRKKLESCMAARGDFLAQQNLRYWADGVLNAPENTPGIAPPDDFDRRLREEKRCEH